MELKSPLEEAQRPSENPLIQAKNAAVGAINFPFEKMAEGLVALDCHPIRVTASKVPVSLLSIAAHQSHPVAGVAGFAVAAILDVLDGKVARKSGKVTVEGAMLDALLDKVVNAYMYFYVATQLDWKNLPVHQAIVLLMALNAAIDLISQRMRGGFSTQIKDALRVIWDPHCATPGKNSQEANMAGKIKAHAQSYGILAALAAAHHPSLAPIILFFFGAAVPLSSMSIYGRLKKK